MEPDWGIEGTRSVREVLPQFLELLDELDAGATFFVVSDLLEDCAGVLRRTAEKHEIGSHGVSHDRFDEMSRPRLLHELEESRRRLEQELGSAVRGLRAPFLARPPGWFRWVRRAGYSYDSSVGSVYPSPQNMPAWRWGPSRQEGVLELPPTTLVTGLVPFSLTYLRLMAPLGAALAPRRGGVLYLHLHELADPDLSELLPPPLRWALRHGAGRTAWKTLRGLLEGWPGPVTSCSDWLESHGL